MFDFNSVEVGGFSPLEPGLYQVYVSEAKFKLSKSGSEYLELRFTTTNNRSVFNNYNLLHPNGQVKNIAMSEIKSLLVASGFNSFNFQGKEKLIEALLSCRVFIKVAIKEDSTYGPKNVIKGYLPLDKSAETATNDIGF
jgi:hypothetical protein